MEQMRGVLKIEINQFPNKHRVCVAQLGSRMHYAIPRMLHDADQLESLYTDICAIKGWPRLLQLLPQILRSGSMERLISRIPEGVPKQKVKAFTRFGWEYAQRRAKVRTQSESIEVFLWAGKAFCDLILREGLGDATCIYTFNIGGLELLKEARKNGLFTVMEQTIAPYQVERRIMQEECEAFPDWQKIDQNCAFADEYAAREREEWEHADIILCGSGFVTEGIQQSGGPSERCCVIPYGVNLQICAPKVRDNDCSPLKVLTVGEVGIRKGSPYVGQAARQLQGRANFRMVGAINVLPDAEKSLRRDVELTGIIPRSQILPQFYWADVFLLPSMCEGSATVVYEALASGLPVICTSNTGSVVRDGVDGFIVPARDTAAIVERIQRLMLDPDLYAEMSKNACERAASFTLESYAQRLSGVFRKPHEPVCEDSSS